MEVWVTYFVALLAVYPELVLKIGVCKHNVHYDPKQSARRPNSSGDYPSPEYDAGDFFRTTENTIRNERDLGVVEKRKSQPRASSTYV